MLCLVAQSCLTLDREAWFVVVHGITKNQTRLNDWTELNWTEEETSVQFSSVQFNRPIMSDSLRPHGLQHASLSCPSPTPRAYSNSCLSSRSCHLTISSSVIPFFSHLQSFPASGSSPVSHLFTSDDQSTRVSASVSVLPVNIQGWCPLRLTGLTSLCPRHFQESSPAPQFKGISSLVFCLLYGPVLTTVHDHWEDHRLDYMKLCRQSNVSSFQNTV